MKKFVQVIINIGKNNCTIDAADASLIQAEYSYVLVNPEGSFVSQPYPLKKLATPTRMSLPSLFFCTSGPPLSPFNRFCFIVDLLNNAATHTTDSFTAVAIGADHRVFDLSSINPLTGRIGQRY